MNNQVTKQVKVGCDNRHVEVAAQWREAVLGDKEARICFLYRLRS